MAPADPDGVVARAVALVEIEEAERLLAAGGGPWTEGELAYARARVDTGRRLAARLAAKRAAVQALGGSLAETDVEVARGEHGPPELRLSAKGGDRLAALGARRALVSLTHERRHAAALVVLLA